MNTEQIIKLGYEAGLCDEEGADEDCIYIHKHLARFVELVLAQREPVAYLCENAVGHKYFRWKKPSSVYKPIALYK